jgi:cytidyltransferase-like protein
MVTTRSSGEETVTSNKIFQTPDDLQSYLKLISPHESIPLVATSGGFDPIHVGHLRCIQETAELARRADASTVVIVNGDGFLRRKKGKPFMSHDERMEIVAGLKGVDYVVGWDDGGQTVTECLRILKPVIFAKGGDRSEPSKVPEWDVCQEIGCEIQFGVGGQDKVQSSTNLLAGVREETYGFLFDSTHKPSIVQKPWGYEEIFVVCDKYAGKILNILPGARLSRQYHEVKDETIYVIQGVLHLEIGGDESTPGRGIVLGPGGSYRIEPGTIHRFGAAEMGVKLFEISTPELSDVCRVSDDYGRL